MRTFVLTLALAALTTAIVAQTTEEEYRYVTFGYQEQLEKGLDDKKGYSWKQLLQHNYTYKKNGFGGGQQLAGVIDFEGLYRDGESTPCALLAIFREKQGLTKPDGVFVCIPSPLSERDLLDKAEKHLKTEARLNSEMLYQYAIALGKLSMNFAQNPSTRKP